MKVGKFINIFGGLFAIIGAVLLISAVMVFVSDRKFMAEAEEISGVVDTIETYRNSDNETNHRVFVNYTYNGQQYNRVRVNFYSSSMYEGKEITLYCDPQHPERVVVQGAGLFGFIVLFFMGILFLCMGILPIVKSVRGKARKKKVRETGRTLYATVYEINYATNYLFNGRHPYIVYCSYRDDYKDIEYRFKSEYIWVNPEPDITLGSMIRVFVEENNYKNYYVDVESMIQSKIVDYT